MADFGKIAFVHIIIAFHLHMVTMAMRSYGLNRGTHKSEDDGIKAMLIIAYLVHLVAFILAVLANFGNLKGNKMVTIAIMVLLFVGVFATIVGVSIYGAETNNPHSYSMSTYITGACAALVAAILMIVQMCGK